MEFNKQTGMGLFVAFIMIFAMVGYAFYFQGDDNTQNTVQIPHIVNRTLIPEEKTYVLRTGRVLIEDLYSPDSQESMDKKASLEAFAEQNQQYVVLETIEVPANETKIQAIGANGDITPLDNFTQADLMERFCLIAILQPKACLLEEY